MIRLARVSIIDQVGLGPGCCTPHRPWYRDVKPSNISVAGKGFRVSDRFRYCSRCRCDKADGHRQCDRHLGLSGARTSDQRARPTRARMSNPGLCAPRMLDRPTAVPRRQHRATDRGTCGLPPPRPSALRSELPAELDTVIATGMAKNPDERYPTVTALTDAARAAIPRRSVLRSAIRQRRCQPSRHTAQLDPHRPRQLHPSAPPATTPPDNFFKRHRIPIAFAAAILAVVAIVTTSRYPVRVTPTPRRIPTPGR